MADSRIKISKIVAHILRSRNRDANHIEHTLDGLLSFCGYEPALALYKKLSRHYWDLDKAAPAYHINAYREMWDHTPTSPRSFCSYFFCQWMEWGYFFSSERCPEFIEGLMIVFQRDLICPWSLLF